MDTNTNQAGQHERTTPTQLHTAPNAQSTPAKHACNTFPTRNQVSTPVPITPVTPGIHPVPLPSPYGHNVVQGGVQHGPMTGHTMPQLVTPTTIPSIAGAHQGLSDPMLRAEMTQAHTVDERNIQALRNRIMMLQQENVELKRSLTDKKVEIKAVIFQNTVLERELEECRAELSAALEHNDASIPKSKRRKLKPNNVGEGVQDATLKSFLVFLSNRIEKIATLSSRDLKSKDPPVREWRGQGEVSLQILEDGSEVNELICADPPLPLSTKHTYYKSVEKGHAKDLLEMTARTGLTESPWSTIVTSTEEKEVYVQAAISDAVLVGNLRRRVNLQHSYRRQRMRNQFFQALGYTSFLVGREKIHASNECTESGSDEDGGSETTNGNSSHGNQAERCNTNKEQMQAQVTKATSTFFPNGINSIPNLSIKLREQKRNNHQKEIFYTVLTWLNRVYKFTLDTIATKIRRRQQI